MFEACTIVRHVWEGRLPGTHAQTSREVRATRHALITGLPAIAPELIDRTVVLPTRIYRPSEVSSPGHALRPAANCTCLFTCIGPSKIMSASTVLSTFVST